MFHKLKNQAIQFTDLQNVAKQFTIYWKFGTELFHI